MGKDGEKAEINITQEIFFSTNPQISSTQLVVQQQIQKVETGISLLLTPVIRGENITVIIEKAEVSEDIQNLNNELDLTNNPYPVVNRRKVHTTVEVGNGKTIVIGGLVSQQVIERISKTPYLGDIPGIGKLFQTIEKQKQDAEVVIFISPRIVRPGCEMVPTVMNTNHSVGGPVQTSSDNEKTKKTASKTFSKIFSPLRQ